MGKVSKEKAWKFGHDLDNDRDIFLFQYSKEKKGVLLESLSRSWSGISWSLLTRNVL